MVTGRQVDEPVLTLVEAAGWLERRFGRRPNVATIWRWATRGIKGVRLATIALGRRRFTTVGALEQFIAESSQPDAGRDRVAAVGGSKVAADTKRFTDAEIATATSRREREKVQAMEYLRSRLAPRGSRERKEA